MFLIIPDLVIVRKSEFIQCFLRRMIKQRPYFKSLLSLSIKFQVCKKTIPVASGSVSVMPLDCGKYNERLRPCLTLRRTHRLVGLEGG